MLCVDYMKYENLYKSFGCSAKENYGMDYVQKLSRKRGGRKHYLPLPINVAHGVFLSLSKMADKPNGTLLRPKEIAQLINRMVSVVTYNKKLQPFVDKLDESDRLLLSKSVKEGVQSEAELLEMLNIAREVKRLYGDSNYSIPFIAIDHDAFRLVTPSYVTQLITHGMPVVNISLTNKFVVDYTNPWFVAIFKNWIVPMNDGTVNQTITTSEKGNYLLANINNIPEKLLKERYAMDFKGMETLPMKSCSLQIKTKRGMEYMNVRMKSEVVKLLVDQRERLSAAELQPYVNTKIGPNVSLVYEEIFSSGVPALGPNNLIGLYDRIVKVINIPVAPIILEAYVFVKKIFDRIKNPEYKSINIIIIANKASGKSKLTNMLSDLLSKRIGERVDVISSDAFGIWRSRIVSEETPQPVSLREALQYGKDDKADSFYYIAMKKILDDNNIKDIHCYENLSSGKRDFIHNQMNKIFVKMCNSKEINGEFYFFDELSTASERTRVSIYEAHFPALDAVMPRTELTSRLLPQLDARLAVINRTGDVVDLALYDTYEIYNSRGHIRMYPSDWIYLLNFETD